MEFRIPEMIQFWINVLVAIAVTVAANAVAVLWASRVKEWAWFMPLNGWLNAWTLPMVLLGILVFATFGRVGADAGLSGASSLIDSLLTPCTVIVGLIFLQEWKKTTFPEYLCMAVIIGAAIALRHFQAMRV